MANSLADQMSKWASQREQRVQLGDQLELPRQIDHLAYFKSKKDAAAASTEFAALGFNVSVKPGIFRSSVEASRDEALTEEDVARFLSEVMGVTERHGGTYDGFGGSVVL